MRTQSPEAQSRQAEADALFNQHAHNPALTGTGPEAPAGNRPLHAALEKAGRFSGHSPWIDQPNNRMG